MRPNTVLMSLLVISLSYAQNPNDFIKMLPSSVTGCLSSGIAAVCGSGYDWTRACQKFVPGALLIGQCFGTLGKCSPSDQLTAENYIRAICVEILGGASYTDGAFTSMPLTSFASPTAASSSPVTAAASSSTSSALAAESVGKASNGALVAGAAVVLALVA